MNTFTKEERLSGKIFIDKLVQKGKSFNCFPFRIVWLQTPEKKAKGQVVISVPKRLFKRAVDRNRLKRIIREGYRKNKEILYSEVEDKTIHLLVIYTSKTKLESKLLEGNIIEALRLLVKKIKTDRIETSGKPD